jgi:hypothetical protein
MKYYAVQSFQILCFYERSISFNNSGSPLSLLQAPVIIGFCIQKNINDAICRYSSPACLGQSMHAALLFIISVSQEMEDRVCRLIFVVKLFGKQFFAVSSRRTGIIIPVP